MIEKEKIASGTPTSTSIKTIAIQGYEGSFHEMAALSYFKEAIQILPSPSFSELIKKLNNEECDGGIMAIENSIAGSILSNYSLLHETELTITGEVYLGIKQNLMALPGQATADIHEVHSHPMALLQCRHFFKQHPHIKLIETEDTALSAKKIRKKGLTHVAAVASDLAATLYNLDMLEENIQHPKNNYTRFLILSNETDLAQNRNSNKATICFKVSHAPGSLAKVLTGIAQAGVNLSKIQSIPVPENEWEYYFYVDMEFDRQEKFEQALTGLNQNAEGVKTMGIYSKGETI